MAAPAPKAASLFLALAGDAENVDAVEANGHLQALPGASRAGCMERGASLPTNDPARGTQHGLATVGGADALRLLAGKSSRARRPGVVAMLDSGVNGTHEDLRGVVSGDLQDHRDHGTGVASVAAAVTNNRLGLASFNIEGALVRVRSYDTFAAQATAKDVAEDILGAVKAEADVINLSFVFPGTAPRVVQLAADHALDAGVILVAAAGNWGGGGSSGDHWPANLPGMIVVGAADADMKPSSWATLAIGDRAILAPGEDVCVASSSGGYIQVSGSSYAAPMVSGLLAAARSACPRLGAKDAARLLRASASYGVVDAPAFLRRLNDDGSGLCRE